MHSWLVWLVFAIACALLGFVGYHFAVHTLRFVTTLFVLTVAVVITRYGVAHQSAGAHADLVNSFTRGFDALSNTFFQPLLGHNNPIPGRLGWLVIIGLLVLGYRELEVWAMSWQPPTLDLSTLSGDKPDTQNGSASGEQGKAATDQQRHNAIASQLRFRLPAVAVRAPAILPGGTGVAGLVSIAESTGNSVGGLAGAIIDFVGTLWPNPRKYQIRIRVEPSGYEHQATESVRVTVDLENSRTGESVATKTLPAGQLEGAGCVVAGYVAQQIFSEDPTAPPWCYGSFDGSDLAALLSAWQDRVYPPSLDEIRKARHRQMHILEKGVSSSTCAGIARYELAQLLDIEGFHMEALRLHAANREDYPLFWRGRYRLGMSLEMIANPEFKLDVNNSKETLYKCLSILDRCRVTGGPEGRHEYIGVREPLPHPLRMELLAAAQHELHAVRRQLTPWRIICAAFVHRDERAIWKHYRGLAERQRFHDGARVAELLVAVRQKLIEKEEPGNSESGSGQGTSDSSHHEKSATRQKQHQGDRARKVIYHLRRAMNKYNLARARWIATAITGDSATLKAVWKCKDNYQPEKNPKPRPHAQRTRLVPWQHSTPSWQAAYNTACLYAALAGERHGQYNKEILAQRVTTSLTRAIKDRHCEMGRPSDWIARDPDFSSVRSTDSYKTFFGELQGEDYPR
jgi:hypothetical protein